MPLSLNAPAPDFDLEGALDGKKRRFRLADFRPSWLVLFFYPADFTFVCPTEVIGFQRKLADFTAAGARLAGISVDDVNCHLDWSKEMGGLSFPLLTDVDGHVASAYGVLNSEDKRAFRATFIISPEGKLGYLTVSPMNVGRSVEETLRVVQAMKTGRLCPADWRPGAATAEPDLKY